MHGDAVHLRDDTHFVHGDGAPPFVTLNQGEERAGGDVDPVQTTAHPSSSLVEVDRGGLLEQVTHDGGEQAKGTAGLGHHLGQGADGNLDAHHVSEELGHAVIGQVLVHRQVDGQGAHSWAVTRRCRGLWWCRCLGLASTRTTATLHAVLGDVRLDRGQLEDLAPLDTHHIGVGEVGATVRAHRRSVGQHLVGFGHLGQVFPLCARLLAWTTFRGPPLGAIGGRGLGESLCRGRHRRVAWVLAQSLLEVSEARP